MRVCLQLGVRYVHTVVMAKSAYTTYVRVVCVTGAKGGSTRRAPPLLGDASWLLFMDTGDVVAEGIVMYSSVVTSSSAPAV